MVDIHCHLLPNTDDGSSGWEMTLEMCRIAEQDGIRHLACTPHANDEFAYDRAGHEQTLSELRTKWQGKLEFSLGCDFHMSFENIQQAFQTPERFTIGRSRYLLVEFSDYAMSPGLGDALQRFRTMDLVPIITHPERNLLMQKRPEQVLRFAELGCAVQVTANALTGYWGPGPQRVGRWLLERRAVHFVASDAHDPKRRPPVLSQAREMIAGEFGNEVAAALASANPGAVVEDLPLPYFPPVTS